MISFDAIFQFLFHLFPRVKQRSLVSKSTNIKKTSDLANGAKFENILLESFIGPNENSSSKIRVRPKEFFDPELRVMFPRDLRKKYPVGTIFSATVNVRNYSIYHTVFLHAQPNTIKVVKDKKNIEQV